MPDTFVIKLLILFILKLFVIKDKLKITSKVDRKAICLVELIICSLKNLSPNEFKGNQLLKIVKTSQS